MRQTCLGLSFIFMTTASTKFKNIRNKAVAIVRQQGRYAMIQGSDKLLGVCSKTIMRRLTAGEKYFDIEFAKEVEEAQAIWEAQNPDQCDDLVLAAAERLREELLDGESNTLTEHDPHDTKRILSLKNWRKRSMKQWVYRAVIAEKVLTERSVLTTLANQASQLSRYDKPEDIPAIERFLNWSRADMLEYLQLRGLPTAQLEEEAS